LYLQENGVEDGRLDAELILAHVLGIKRLDLYLQFERPLAPRELEAFKTLLRRRVKREPLQYVLGFTAFRELELKTDFRALIPRPETERLVEEVLAWSRGAGENLVALDLGTGTGAIGLSLLSEGPFRQVVATDPDRNALDLARENALAMGLEPRLDLRHGHLFEPVSPGETFDVVVSNPPYVPETDGDSLQPEVVEWEPPGALFAGPTGMDVLAPLVEGAQRILRAGGLLAVEVGDGQAEAVARALDGSGAYRDVKVVPDLSGRDRIVRGVASE
jgi:release factor glutamine methyltransferase